MGECSVEGGAKFGP
uniref:Uncharacterized protein n=1 Tax=Vitis vinifera TaxID=29760 RepID=F6HJZ3_VITVI